MSGLFTRIVVGAHRLFVVKQEGPEGPGSLT